jgi:hypothetical protein
MRAFYKRGGPYDNEKKAAVTFAVTRTMISGKNNWNYVRQNFFLYVRIINSGSVTKTHVEHHPPISTYLSSLN